MEQNYELLHVSDIYRPHLLDTLRPFYLRSLAKILVVVDTEINLTPSSNAFGIGRVIELIRGASVGCMHFNVTLARRSGLPPSTNPAPGPYQPKYEGFRFDNQEPDGSNTIDLFHEIWCFGFKPDNFGGPDANITLPASLPITNSELQVLTRWMNERQGGVFATGDHDYLGASMCSRMPRVGTMRLWTNADGVPPLGGPDRIDTNRPATPGQSNIAGTPDVMPFDNQSDTVVQPIQWQTWFKDRLSRYAIIRWPHPILCHPTHGPIDVMPDHPHEGRCFDTAINPATGNAEIRLNGNYNFLGYAGDDYPTIGGVRPTPKVIAYGTTLPDPPYNHDKGDSPYKRFPMISIYDGHVIGLGRVAVDSTWHHWMDINIWNLELASDKTNWEKISRYFINLAQWLAPSYISRSCFIIDIYQSFFEYLGFREYSPAVSIFELGYPLKIQLIRSYGPCGVLQFILDWVKLYDEDLFRRLIERYIELPIAIPRPDPCLSCPPLELLEDAILGGMIREAMDIVIPIREQLERQEKPIEPFNLEELEKAMISGVGRGLAALSAALDVSLEYSKDLYTIVGGPDR
jgi:hypothetical protein